MSKITNDCLTWPGTGCFIAESIYDNSGRQGLNKIKIDIGDEIIRTRR